MRNFVLIARVHQIDSGLVEFFAGQRALRKQFFAAVINLLLRLKLLLSCLGIELRFLQFLWQVGGSGGFVGGLRLIECAFAVLRGGSQIAIFQHCQQLPGANMASAID